MANAVRIETERLLLREPLPGDAEVWSQYITDPDFRRYVPVRRSSETPVERATRGLRSVAAVWEQAPRTSVEWVIARRADGQMIGMSGIDGGEAPGEGELDYKFGKPFWGQGYGREAAHAMSRFVVEQGLFEELTAYIVPGNDASIRIAKSLGLRFQRIVDYMQFFPDPSIIDLANPMTELYSARREDVTLDDRPYRVLDPVEALTS